jgi:hypothetical protein
MPVAPFGGWVACPKLGRLVPSPTPHILGLAPPGVGKIRRWLAQSAVLLPGPAVVSSGKGDLMRLVSSRRRGRAQLLDLSPIDRPAYPNEFISCRYDPTTLIRTLEDAQAVAETLLGMSSVGFGGSQARPAADNGMWENLAFAPLTCLLFAGSPAAVGFGMVWVLEAAEDVNVPLAWPRQVSTDPSWVTAAPTPLSTFFRRPTTPWHPGRDVDGAAHPPTAHQGCPVGALSPDRHVPR